MSGFFRGPSLFTHFFICAIIAAVLAPLAKSLTGSIETGLWVAVGWFIIYWLFAALWVLTKISVLEFMLVLLTIGILAALVMPVVHDPAYQAFLQKSQVQMVAKANVVILAEQTDSAQYKLTEIWVHTEGYKLPWAIGETIKESGDRARLTGSETRAAIIFYCNDERSLRRLGSFRVRDGTLRTKLDIGERNKLEQWFDKPVTLSAFKQYVTTLTRENDGSCDGQS